MKFINATGKEWRPQCMRCAQAGEDFEVAGYLASDVLFLRNVGFFYHYAVSETPSSFYFKMIAKI